MKFKQYIRETPITYGEQAKKVVEDFKKSLRTADKNYMKNVILTGIPFLRDMPLNRSEMFVNKKTYPDRRPKDTPDFIHELVDDWFQDVFGWRARSENVLFCWVAPDGKFKSGNVAYNEMFIIIPNKIDMIIGSEKYDDLFGYLEDEIHPNPDQLDIDKVLNFLKKGNYKKFSIREAMKLSQKITYEHEMMIKCGSYSGIPLWIVRNWAPINLTMRQKVQSFFEYLMEK